MKLSVSPAVIAGDIKQAFQEITETTAEALDVRQVSVSLLDDTESELCCADAFDRTRGIHVGGTTFPASSFPRYFESLRGGRAIDAADARRDRRTSEFAVEHLTHQGITRARRVGSCGRPPCRVVLLGTLGQARKCATTKWGSPAPWPTRSPRRCFNAQRNGVRDCGRVRALPRVMADAAPVMVGGQHRQAL